MVIKEHVNDVIDWCKEAGVSIPKGFTELRNLTNYYGGAKNDGVAERCYKMVKRLLRQPNRENKKKVVDVIAVWTALKDMAPQKAVERSVGRQDVNSEERTYLLTGEGEEKIMAEQYNFVKPLQDLLDETRTVLQERLKTASEDQKVRINKQIEFITEQISELDKVNDVSSQKASDAAWEVYGAVKALRDSIKGNTYGNVDNSVKGKNNVFDNIRNGVGAMIALGIPKKSEKVSNAFEWHYGNDLEFIAELLVKEFEVQYDDLKVAVQKEVSQQAKNIDRFEAEIADLNQRIYVYKYKEYPALKARYDNGEIGKATYDSESNRIYYAINELENQKRSKEITLQTLRTKKTLTDNLTGTILGQIEKFLVYFMSSNETILGRSKELCETLANLYEAITSGNLNREKVQYFVDYTESLIKAAENEISENITPISVIKPIHHEEATMQTNKKGVVNLMEEMMANEGDTETVTNNVVDPTVTTVIKPVTNDTTNRDD